MSMKIAAQLFLVNRRLGSRSMGREQLQRARAGRSVLPINDAKPVSNCVRELTPV